MPALQDFANVVGPRVSSCCPSRPIAAASRSCEILRRHAITTLPIWVDPKAQAAEAWGVRGLPTTLIVDRQGRETDLEGAIDWAADATVAGVKRLVG